MPEIYLLRHGAYDEKSTVLNERGKKQIQSVINILEKISNSWSIFSSEGPRATQTALIISNSLGTPYETVSWLNKPNKNEKFDFNKVDFLVGTKNSSALLITSGEFIHQYVEDFSRRMSLKNPLKRLVKREVIFCQLNKMNINVTYF